MPGEIAAVDRRHVERRAAAAASACRTSCRSVRGRAAACRSVSSVLAAALDQACPCRHVAEVVRGEVRQQRQADVGRRRAMRDDRRADVPGCCPAAASCRPRRRGSRRNAQVRRAVVRRKSVSSVVKRLGAAAIGRLSHHAISGASQPQQQHRRGDRPAPAAAHASRYMADARSPAPARSTSRGTRRAIAVARVALDFARRRPLQQVPARDQHAHAGAHDRVEAEVRFVRQAREREQRVARNAAPRDCADARRCCAEQRLRRLAQPDRACSRRAPAANVHAEHRQRPQPRRRQHDPAQQQQQRSAPPARGCGAGCRGSSTATAATADCVRRCRRRPARAATASARSASRRESSDGGGCTSAP